MISLVREKYLSRIRPFYHNRDMIKVLHLIDDFLLGDGFRID